MKSLTRSQIQLAVHPSIVNPWSVSPAQQREWACKEAAAIRRSGAATPRTWSLDHDTRDHFLDDLGTELRGRKPSPLQKEFDPSLGPTHVEIAQRDTDAGRAAYVLLGEIQPRCFVLDHDWKAPPGTDVINQATGEITVVPEPFRYNGGDLTVGQLADRLGMGPRKARATLVDLGMLHGEVEAKMVPMVADSAQLKPEYSARLRLSEWAVKMHYGRRVKAMGHDLDWITPTGRDYIEEVLALSAVRGIEAGSGAPKSQPKAIDVIRELLESDPTLRQVDIIRLTGLSRMTVHRNLRLLTEKVTSQGPSAI